MAYAPRQSYSSGFTLIELLVVIVLVGLLASIGLTTVGSGNQGRALNNEVNRLHSVLRMASEEAIFSNTEIGVRFGASAYEFVVYDEEGRKWSLSEEKFLQAHELPEWVLVEWNRDDEVELPSAESTGVTEDQQQKTPDLMLLSSGEVTPFTIGLEIENDPDSRLEIKTDDQGEIILPHVLERDS